MKPFVDVNKKYNSKIMKRSRFISNLLSVFTCLILAALLSCNQDDEPESAKQYKGNWTGNYTGAEDNGTWEVFIGEDGNIAGTATSLVLSATYNLTGTVSAEGDFNATAGSATTGTTFKGTLTANSGQGTWENSATGNSGTWTGSKE